ncbi:MAG: hypothetical protein ACD_43C00212G0004 [uncultured bacterium]|nr:MAG: hypothetical protein ACD_43C00212G0004 [uncultured bacterium]
MSRKKILVISYGGTIVMVVDEKSKSVKPASNIKEVISIFPNLEDLANIEIKVLSNKDSTNVTPEDWTKLAKFIYEQHDNYDGFVITHGTNTMAYTASALALALGRGLKKPVILTGSQLPLTVFGNDARFNFEHAVATCVAAAEKHIAEVLIVFNDKVLRGSRSVKISESSFRAFESPAFHQLGTITANGVSFSPDVHIVEEAAPFRLQPNFDGSIFSIDLTPGQRPELIENLVKSGQCDGLILKSHGAGSVPTEGRYSFLPLIKMATSQYKIPVVVSTKFLGGNVCKIINDEPAVLAVKYGAIPSGDITDVMTEVKLMWLMAQGLSSIEEVGYAMLHSYVGEVSSMGKQQV